MRSTALTIALVLACSVGAQVPMLWADLRPGRFIVGYLHLLHDSSPVDLWYPAASPGEAMRFSSYLGERSGATKAFLERQGLSEEAVAALIEARVYATYEAAPSTERFGLILVAQGNGQDAADQAILAEYIASHGYVVASVPSPMIREQMTDESQIGVFAEKQADALDEAARVASRVLNVKTRQIAVIGHSFGARAALLLAMRRHIRAIVSLDGGIGTATGTSYLEAAPSFRPRAQLPPVLHLYEDLDSFMRPDFSFLSRLRIEHLRSIRTHDMHHIHFTSYGFAAAMIPPLAAITKAGPDIKSGVGSVAREVLHFLQRELG